MQPLTIRATRDYVIVQAIDERVSVTASGLQIIQSSSSNQALKAVVVAVGPGKMKNGVEQPVKLTVNLGDTVLITQGTGTKCKIEGRDCIILKEDDVLAIYE